MNAVDAGCESPARLGSKGGALWDRHAAQWHLIGAPLRPVREDVEIVQRELDRLARVHARLRALLLGVTVELARLQWPRDASLLAVDASAAMVREHWRPPAGIHSLALRGNWQNLPVVPGEFHLVMADGSFCVMPDLLSIRQALQRVAEALHREGRLVLRSFARPEVPEPLERVLDDLRAGRIGSMHAAKWRLAMALHGGLAFGVQLDSVWRAFRKAEPDSVSLARRTGWPVAAIDTIEAYRGVHSRYYFPTLPELRDLVSLWFAEVSCHVPTYELGERCPTLVLAPR